MISVDDVLNAQGTTHPCITIQLLLSFGFFILGLGSLETSTLLPIPLYGCWSTITLPKLTGIEMCPNVILVGKTPSIGHSMLNACGVYSWWQPVAWAGSLLIIGRMLICIAAGIGSDVFGRRRSVIVWMAVYFVFSFARSFAPMVEVYVMCVTMEAISSQAASLSLLLMAIEGSTQKECVRSACLVLLGHAVGVSVGIPLLSSLIDRVTFRQLARSLPSVGFILFIFFLPEGFRWTITNGKLEQIQASIKVSHKLILDDQTTPKVAAVYPQMRKDLSECRSRGNPLKQSVVPVLLAKSLLRVVPPFILISFIAGAAISFRLIHDPLPYHSFEDRVIASGVAELLALQLLGLLLARLAVKKVLLILCIMMALALVFTKLLFKINVSSCIGNVFFSSGGHFITILFWVWLLIGVTRLVPTHSRGAMLGFCLSFGTLGHNLATVIFDGLYIHMGEYYPALVFSGLVIIGGLLALILPATPPVLPDMLSHVAPHLFWDNNQLPTYVSNQQDEENTSC